MRLRRLILLPLVLLLPALGAAQPSSRGTEFWLTFMQSLVWRISEMPPGLRLQMQVNILSERGATCFVEMPGVGWSTTVTVPPAGETVITLPSTIEFPYRSDSVQALGIHVVASDSVTVLALNYIEGSADAALILPVDQLSDDYVVSAYDAFVENGEQYYPSEFAIVATEDGTLVEITPSVPTATGRPGGVPYTVRLDRGEVYQVQAWEDLTGSRVRGVEGGACRRFALFGGSVLTLVGDCEAGDHLYEQMLPLDQWGTEFPLIPLAQRTGGEIYEIVAGPMGSTVQIPQGATVNMAGGASLRVQLESPGILRASGPIAVAQLARGGGCDDNESSDPLMVLIPPFERAIRTASWSAYRGLVFTTHFLNIGIPTSAVPSLRIDGAPVAGTFTPFTADPAWSWAKLAVDSGYHSITAAEGFVAWAYGFAAPIAYGYPIGLSFDPPPVVSFDVVSQSGTYCAGEPIDFIERTDGREHPLEWDFGDGTVGSGSRPTHRFDSAGSYLVRVRARIGRSCAGESVQRVVTIHPRPPLPSIEADCGCDSVRLTAPEGLAAYRWSTGDTTRSIVVTGSARVGLTVRSAQGCESDPADALVAVASQPGDVEISVDRSEVEAGGIVAVQLAFPPISDEVVCRPARQRIVLSHSASMLAPDFIRGGEIIRDTIAGGRRYLTVEATADSVLIEMIAGLGADTTSPIVLEGWESEVCGVAALGDTVGLVHLSGVCQDGGVRLFLDTEPATLKPVRPDPVTGSASLELVASHEAHAILALHDASGRRVLLLHDGTITVGHHSIELDASSLPPGRYYLIFSSGRTLLMRGLSVVR